MNMQSIYPASAENVKHLGRTYFNNGRLFCALSGSGAEFSFTGTKCTVTISGDDRSTAADNKDNLSRIAFYVNHERVIDEMVDFETKEYVVCEFETVQEATVTIVKLTEAPMSTYSIDAITVESGAAGVAEHAATDAPVHSTIDAPIRPTSYKDCLIEFVGDSITCGYGVDDPVAENHFVTRTEDVTKAYAYKTAKALDADYSMVSFSGYGIISGYTEEEQPLTTQLVPPLYPKLGYTWTCNRDFSPSDIEWDFSVRRPDLIVINLGTNDDSYCKDVEERQETYCAAYTEFLKLVRKLNPSSKILCTLGMMGDRLFPYVQKAVDCFVSETGDNNTYTMKFEVQLLEDGYSADYHPSITTHDKAAAKLVAKIKELMK